MQHEHLPLVEAEPSDVPSPIISTLVGVIEALPTLPPALTCAVNTTLSNVEQFGMPIRKCGFEQVGDDCAITSLATVML